MSEYQGWSLFDKVQLVCRKSNVWADGEYKTLPLLQGYVVDPSNKSMKESAVRWAKSIKKVERQSDGSYKYIDVEPTVFDLDNEGFTLTLLESAKGSSQGGKLSFWNCLISKGENTWKIGIGSDLLLDLLKESTFIKGVCQQKLFFARCGGQVGMLHSECNAYKQAKKDMDTKATVKSSKKTTKWLQGHNYVTLTTDTTYLITLYRWLVPMYVEDIYSYHRYQKFVGYKKLKTPEIVHYCVETDPKASCLSDYVTERNYMMYPLNKFPARMQGDKVIKIDMTNEEVENFFIEQSRTAIKNRHQDVEEYRKKKYSYNMYPERTLGLTPFKDKFVLPNDIKDMIIDMGLKYEEE